MGRSTRSRPQAEPGQQAAGLGLGRVAAGVLESVVGPAPAGDQPLVAGLVLHRGAQLLQPGGQLVEAPAAEHVADRGDVGGRRRRGGGPGGGSRTPRARWMTPALGSAMPPSTRSSEVLPAPLRPTRPTRSPARTVKPAPSTTRMPPTSTVSPRTDNMAGHGGRAAPAIHPNSVIRLAARTESPLG